MRSFAVSFLVCALVLGNARPIYAAEAAPEAEATPAPADPSIVSTNGIAGWPQARDIFSDSAVLMDAGVREENITLPNLCTACNADLLFSHRASHGKRGNLGAFLMIK